MGDRYKDRELVWVTPFTGSTIKFGFQTNADAAVKGVLGHTDVGVNYPEGLVIGANAPIPATARRERITGSDSSYCDAEAVAAARVAGWKISAGKIRVGSAKLLSKTVFVTYPGGLKYAWNMPNTTYTNIGGDLAALGIQLATSSDEDLIFGASYPKVPRVKKVTFGAGGKDVISTFVDPQRLDNLPVGWSTIRASKDKF